MPTRQTTPRLNAADRHMVRTITDRLHVGTTLGGVVRHLADRFRRAKQVTPKPLRKAAYRYAIQCHRENCTYYVLTTGRI